MPTWDLCTVIAQASLRGIWVRVQEPTPASSALNTVGPAQRAQQAGAWAEAGGKGPAGGHLHSVRGCTSAEQRTNCKLASQPSLLHNCTLLWERASLTHGHLPAVQEADHRDLGAGVTPPAMRAHIGECSVLHACGRRPAIGGRVK